MTNSLENVVTDLLRRNWNPFNDGDGLLFTAYVSEVMARLEGGVTAKELAEFLSQVEASRLGFVDTPPSQLVSVARKLLRVARRAAPN